MTKPTTFFNLTRTVSLFFLMGSLLFFSSCKRVDEVLDELLDGDDDHEEMKELRIFASTNTGGNFTIFDVSDLHDIDKTVAKTGSMDADGIFYRADKDIVYQLSRTDNMVNAYSDITDLMGKENVRPAFSSTADFTNGREIAVNEDILVVAEDVTDANQLVVYTVYQGSLRLERVYNVHFNLWGIQLVGNTLFAIQDNTDKLAVFNNFGSKPEGDLQPNQVVSIEGIVRTHGISYNDMNDIMVLTDVGEGAIDDDGAFHVIENFSTKLDAAGDGGAIMMDDQVRVAGDMTFLGNPVDVALSVMEKKVYVAERANGGGRLLIFDYPTKSGNIKPVANVNYEGASAVYLDEPM